MTPRRALLLLVYGLVPLPVAVAQAGASRPSQTDIPTIHVSSQLVTVDVVVLDKSGKPVKRQLTRDDFIVEENGTAQNVRNFETPEQHTMPQTGQAIVHSFADLKRIGNAPVTILVLDELNNRFEDTAYARQMLVKYLNSQPAVLTTPTALMVAESNTFQQLHDYTQDRNDLLASLKKHMPQFPYKATDRRGAGAVERMAQVLASLQQIAESATGTPGRKNLIWVGSGFPSVDLTGLDIATAQALKDAFRRVTTRLLVARVTIYTINPTLSASSTVDVEDPSDLDMAVNENGADPFGSGDIDFASLALSTGGLAFTGRNDLNNLIRDSIDQGRFYYTLSYRPTQMYPPGQHVFRSIRVLMRDKNLHAVSRSGYYPDSAADVNPVLDKTMAPKQMRSNLELDLSAALTTTISYNGLSVTAQRDGNGFSIHADEQGIEWSQPNAKGEQQAEATLAAGWYNDKGKLLGHVVREEVARRNSKRSGADYHLPVSLPPRVTRVRIVVRDTRSGRMGTFDLMGF